MTLGEDDARAVADATLLYVSFGMTVGVDSGLDQAARFMPGGSCCPMNERIGLASFPLFHRIG
jgi:hypothetical protein